MEGFPELSVALAAGSQAEDRGLANVHAELASHCSLGNVLSTNNSHTKGREKTTRSLTPLQVAGHRGAAPLQRVGQNVQVRKTLSAILMVPGQTPKGGRPATAPWQGYEVVARAWHEGRLPLHCCCWTQQSPAPVHRSLRGIHRKHAGAYLWDRRVPQPCGSGRGK